MKVSQFRDSKTPLVLFFFSPCCRLLWTYIPRICCGYKLQIDYTFNKCVNVALLANFSGHAGEGHGGMKDGTLHWPQYIRTDLKSWHTNTPESDMYFCRREKFFRVWPVASFSKHWKLKYMVTQQRTHR